jgi:transcriptional regulator with XRE-family HTH domain
VLYNCLNEPSKEVYLRPLEGVRELRERRMLSQQELADRAGVSLFTVQRIERGEGSVRPKTGRAIAAALGVRVEDLLGKVQAPLPNFEDERRIPTLQGWIALAEGLGERWSLEIDRRTEELRKAGQKPPLLPRLVAATWAKEAHGTYGNIVDGLLEDPLLPRAYPPEECIRLYRALQRMHELLIRTDPWFERGDAQVIDLRQARRAREERMERELGSQAS